MEFILGGLKHRETPGQKFRVYFLRFSDFWEAQAGDLCLAAPPTEQLESNPVFQKLETLGCSVGANGTAGAGVGAFAHFALIMRAARGTGGDQTGKS